ncbi:S49 family peptidase [Halodesulfovibrio aestuarii]|uniref:S49 family peptidase n=1 Tax=Halodesulfovibrio aestuarii TaxID=126333 RepID=UPI003D351C94
MSLKILQGELFAILPEKLEAICEVVEAHAEGRTLAFTGTTKRSNREDEPYETRSGIAIINMYGVMGRRLDAFEEMCGGCSCQTLGKHINHALANDAVDALLVDVDSPGGTLAGLDELSGTIMRGRNIKPIVAYTDANMCSAAYWVASSATAIVSTKSATVGSIGVFTTHYDESAKDAARGVTRTIIKAGAYKAAMSESLTDESLGYMQGHLQAAYDTFVEAVAEHRGVEVEAVHPAMADGKIFTGKQALSAGLVDHIGDMEFALDLAGQLAANFNQEKNMGTEAVKQAAEQSINYAALTVEGLKVHAPSLVEAIAGEAANNSEAIAKAAKDATDAERSRAVEIIKSGASNELALKAIEGGEPAHDIYRQMVTAMQEGKADALASMEGSLGEGVDAKGEEKKPDDAGGGGRKPDFMALVADHVKAEKIGRGEATKAMARQHPEAYQAWLNR